MTELALLTLIRIGAYAAVFTPLVVHTSFVFPFVVPKTVAFWIIAEILFALWLILAFLHSAYRPRLTGLAWGVLLFSAANVASALVGINTAHSFWSTYERMGGVIALFHLAAFFIVLTSVFTTRREWRRFWMVSLGAASLVAALFFVKRLGVFTFPLETYGGSTLGNSSFMGAYLLFHVFMGLWLLGTSSYLEARLLYGLLVLFFTAAVWYAQALGAFFSILAGLFFIGMLTLFFEGGVKRKIAALVLLLFASVAGAVIFIGTITQNERIVTRLPAFFSSGSIKSRIVVWDIAWRGFQERPLLGWGPENFHAVFEKYFNPCLPLARECGGELWFDRTHNILLDQFVQGGIVGAFAYLFLFAAAAWSIFRRWVLSRRFLLWGIITIALLGSYFIQNLFVFDMPSVSMMFFAFLAFANARTPNVMKEERAKRERARRFLSVWFVSGGVVILFAFSLFPFGYRTLQSAHNVFLVTARQAPMSEAVPLYEKTLRLSPLATPQAQLFFTSAITERVRGGEKISKESADVIIQEVKKLIEGGWKNLRLYYTLGNFYNVMGYREDKKYFNEARKVLRDSIEISPRNQQGYMFLAESYLGMERYEEAVELLQKAVDLEPRLAAPHLALAKALFRAGRTEEARASAERSLELDPSLKPQVEALLRQGK